MACLATGDRVGTAVNTFLWADGGVSNNNSRELTRKTLALWPGEESLEGDASVVFVVNNATPDVP